MSRLARLPRWVRVCLTASMFALFFGSSTLWGLALVLLRPFRRKATPAGRARFTRKLNVGLGRFLSLLRDIGLIAYWAPQLPPGYHGRPYVLVANHPTLLDILIIMSSIPEVVCVVHAKWHRSLMLGPLLRLTEYVPGPGYDGDANCVETAPVVSRIERKLAAGVPVVVFPEGSRSPPSSLRRFRRGAIQAAVSQGVPILPLFIAIDRPMLTKERPFWHLPKEGSRYWFEWLEPIETEGRDLDARELTRDLAVQYQARLERLLEERKALESTDASERRRRRRARGRPRQLDAGLDVAPVVAADEERR